MRAFASSSSQHRACMRLAFAEASLPRTGKCAQAIHPHRAAGVARNVCFWSSGYRFVLELCHLLRRIGSRYSRSLQGGPGSPYAGVALISACCQNKKVGLGVSELCWPTCFLSKHIVSVACYDTNQLFSL
jgi:hypothetical protein